MDIELEDFKSAASALVSPNLYKSENSAWDRGYVCSSLDSRPIKIRILMRPGIEAMSAVSCAH